MNNWSHQKSPYEYLVKTKNFKLLEIYTEDKLKQYCFDYPIISDNFELFVLVCNTFDIQFNKQCDLDLPIYTY